MAVLAVLALVATVVAVVAITGGDDAASADILLEPAGVEVPDPFTANAATDEVALAPSSTTAGSATTLAAGVAGGAVAGSAPGLYGGTRDRRACDVERLVTFLEANEDKAAAWAGVQGISVEGIRDFVATLTPVVLRWDTRVLNHGYRDGRATPRAAVLQAGTAVLVDRRGIPRVKCSCGNPLGDAPPVTSRTRYTGTRWVGFSPARVVVVKVDVSVSVFVLVDITTGKPFGRPAGSAGAKDTAAPGAERPSTTTTPPSTTAPVTSDGTSAPKLFEIASIAGVSNGPTSPSVMTLDRPATVTAISTYHWNDAQGATPGTLGLRSADGTMYGPFPTTGSDGQGGVPNATWTAIVNVEIPAGTYTVVDSSPSTWAWAPDTGGRGMVTVYGHLHAAPTTRPPTTAPPTTAAPDHAKDAIAAVEGSFCGQTPGVDEDWRTYITSITAERSETDLYRVQVRIELDSGAWTALYDVDFATEGGPDVRPLNDESADLICG